MTEADSGLFTSTPEAVFYLTANREAADDLSAKKVEFLDDRPGAQATLDLEHLADSEIFNRVLRHAKVGSRWGKDLSEVYRDYLQARIEQVDESILADEFEAQFTRFDADPYESAVLGDAMTIGVDVAEQIQKGLNQWDKCQFTRDDLAAAVGISAESDDMGGKNTYGGIIFQSETPLSEIKQDQPFARASGNLRELLLIGLDVALVAPVGQPNEQEIVETTFRSVGSFSIEANTSIDFEVSDEIMVAVDKWYDRLRYPVGDNRVAEAVVRPASVTAYDLPDEPWSQHFKNAIITGLQGAYSRKSFNKDLFDELWDERISSHPNYDQYRSRRSTFPKVKVSRKEDEISREFRLHHEGPSAKPYICSLPARSSNPEPELIEWIEQFLNAECVSEQRWQELAETFYPLNQSLDSKLVSLVESALLHRNRQRKSISPLILPDNISESIPSKEENEYGYDDGWYDEHWSTILSDFEITKQGGIGAIERKQELQNSLDPELDADKALYHKLERDISNAWEYYLDGVINELRQSLTDDQNLSIERRETRSGKEIEATIAPDSGPTRTVMIDVLFPFSEVYVEDTQVRKATITNTVSKVMDVLRVSPIQDQKFSEETKSNLLYEITKVYLNVAEFERGDLMYFDDIVEFCLSLPGFQRRFEAPEQSAEATIRDVLGSESYMNRLRESDVTFHRKGSDQRGSIKVKDDRYIAMELHEPLN